MCYADCEAFWGHYYLYSKASVFVKHISTRRFKLLHIKQLKASKHNAKENKIEKQ